MRGFGRVILAFGKFPENAMATRIFVIMLVVCGLVALPATARRLEDWPYDKLMKEADLVVVATAVKTVETKDEMGDPAWKKRRFIGQDTTLEVITALKGKVDEKRIKVLHFKLPHGDFIINGPLFFDFRAKPLEIRLKTANITLGSPDYLLYLKRMKDGRYEPVSGRFDPALSVREMMRPFPEFLEALARPDRPDLEPESKLEPRKGLPEVTKEHLTSKVPNFFSLDYDFEPMRGKRLWLRIDDKHFIERFPDGHESKFKLIGRTKVDGIEGTVVAKIAGEEKKSDSPNDGTFQVFIPDRGGEKMKLLFRKLESDGGRWNSLSFEMKMVE
jgi:hypothetical protein